MGIFGAPTILSGQDIDMYMDEVYETLRGDFQDEMTREEVDEAMQKDFLNQQAGADIDPLQIEDVRVDHNPAFFDTMVSAYKMTKGPGCIAGEGIKLRTQVGFGRLRIGRSSAWSQFRGDFLIDEKLVVEIDGETWHGSRDAKARDASRDEVIRAEGYTILRIPASVVFNSPTEAVRRVEEARRRLRAAA